MSRDRSLVRLSARRRLGRDPGGRAIAVAYDESNGLWQVRVEDDDEEHLDSHLRAVIAEATRQRRRRPVGSSSSPTRSSTSSTTPKGDVMDIGKPERIYTVEPLEDPVPQTRPAKRDEPAQPQPATPREPEQVPAGA